MDKNFESLNLKNIINEYFQPFWKLNASRFPKETQGSILSNVYSFLACGDFSLGYSTYKCPRCLNLHNVAFSCKSRFCISCGITYAQKWSANLEKSLFDVPHLHIILSLPEGNIRNFFFTNRHLLADLAVAAKVSLEYTFKKCGIKKFGAIAVIHTFSRTLDWNPHIHLIATYGGFDKNNSWKKIKSIPYQVFRKSWQKCALDIIANFAKTNNSSRWKNRVSIAYKNYTSGFYVNADRTINNIFNIGKYIGRYLARPAISENRLVSIVNDQITFWYKNPDSDEKLFKTMHINKFLGKLLSHIPLKNFKMVRRFGLYSRRNKLKMPKKISSRKTNLSWAQRVFQAFGINPLICNKCGSPLILFQIVHLLYGGIIYSNNDFP